MTTVHITVYIYLRFEPFYDSVDFERPKVFVIQYHFEY